MYLMNYMAYIVLVYHKTHKNKQILHFVFTNTCRMRIKIWKNRTFCVRETSDVQILSSCDGYRSIICNDEICPKGMMFSVYWREVQMDEQTIDNSTMETSALPNICGWGEHKNSWTPDSFLSLAEVKWVINTKALAGWSPQQHRKQQQSFAKFFQHVARKWKANKAQNNWMFKAFIFLSSDKITHKCMCPMTDKNKA